MIAFYLLIAASLGIIVYLANLQQIHHKRPQSVNYLLYSLAALTFGVGFLTLFAGVSSELLPESAGFSINRTSAAVFFVLAAVAAVFSAALVRWRGMREWIAQWVLRSDGTKVRYNAASPVHTTAIVMAILLVIGTMSNFVLAGGVDGLAEDYAQSINLVETLVSNFLLYLMFSLLGVGLFLRRNVAQALQRLGLSPVRWRHILLGLLIGFALYWVQVGLVLVWEMLAPDSLTQQSGAAQELFNLFSGSLLLGFLLAVSTGIGEELFFRGALQPIFGIFWTSLFFILLHTQYTLTFASLVIFLVSVGFGILARRFSTVAAMSAHVIYNFMPFLLVWALGQFGITF